MPGVTYQPNTIAAPEWAGDFGGREHIMAIPAKIDPTLFTDGLGIPLVVGSAGALANATTIPLTAAISGLQSPINVGSTLSFGAAGSKKFAKLTATAKNGDTSLTVEALPTALVSTDTAVWSKFGRKTIKSGTLIGRTYAERDAGASFGPAVYNDDEFYILMFDRIDAFNDNDIELYRPTSQVKENFLPEWTTISVNAQLLAKLRSTYQCYQGVR